MDSNSGTVMSVYVPPSTDTVFPDLSDEDGVGEALHAADINAPIIRTLTNTFFIIIVLSD
jgi:hypothetical protein